jgi:DNA polymerase-3 subunit epsilon
MYAIVDIETTGGYAANNDITELAIVLHDGNCVVDRFESLVKPEKPIPYFIQVLTGIRPEMVANAPTFNELASEIYHWLNGNVFIAHNVNFDYSFLKYHLAQAGFELDTQKLCTVRLARKVFPGLGSYSLGKLCRHFSIEMENRHRAGGDADATVRLFEHMLRHNGMEHVQQFLKKGSGEQYLPQNLPKQEIDKLPYTPGVYYFHDQKGKIIYVGKARNIKYRVRSHFAHNGPGRQRQDFMRNIFSISYQECGTELMAFILESIEIKRLWPQYNSSQKRFSASYGLYVFEDRKGYLRLAIDKKKKNTPAVYTFELVTEGRQLLGRLVKRFGLCPKLCFIQTDQDKCTALLNDECGGACEQLEDAASYNRKVHTAINSLDQELPTFAVMDEGNTRHEQSCVLIEKGRFYGMGYIANDTHMKDIDSLKPLLTQYPENDYIRGLIYNYVAKRPEKKRVWGDAENGY